VIYFLTAPEDRHYIERGFLDGPGRSLLSRLEVLTYEEAHAAPVRPGTYIFGGCNHLLPPDQTRAAEIWSRLSDAGPDVRPLNDPIKSLRREELLSTLHARGVNSFRARPFVEPGPPLRFPVFIRHVRRHNGALTRLLHDQRELDVASDVLQAFEDPANLLVVEFCDTSDEEGVFRKYSVFLIGDRTVPRYVFFSRDWMVKGVRVIDERKLKEEHEFVETNPHEQWVRDVFGVAGIEYGRVDYSLLDGRSQLWEINTNPGVWHNPGEDRLVYQALVAQRLVEAFEELDREVVGSGVAGG
jgi:hypothetical protein